MSKKIILDIDNTLVYILPKTEEIVKSLNVLYDSSDVFYFKTNDLDFVAVKRPGLDIFLDYCEVNFDHVIVWSAADYGYVKSVTKKLFKNRRIDAVLTRNDIKDMVKCDDGTWDYHKPLLKITEKYPEFNINPENTVFVDDVPSNFRTTKNSGIAIPSFDVQNVFFTPNQDNHLISLLLFFNSSSFATSKDITKVNKTRIFNKPKGSSPNYFMISDL